MTSQMRATQRVAFFVSEGDQPNVVAKVMLSLKKL
jgi:hypothetical protein